MFEQVQQTRGVYKGKWGSKQFAFRGLLKCGRCGADITAQEKFKKLKNGEFNRHVYYNCTRRVDPNCTEKYINEKDLCVLLQEFVENHYRDITINDKLRARIEKHYRITKALLAHHELDKILDDPIIEYSRYVLSRGTEAEKIAYANGFVDKLTINQGVLKVA